MGPNREKEVLLRGRGSPRTVLLNVPIHPLMDSKFEQNIEKLKLRRQDLAGGSRSLRDTTCRPPVCYSVSWPPWDEQFCHTLALLG